jgi:hypothetical protein
MMPVREIEACLRRLDPSGQLREQFWNIEDHSEPELPPSDVDIPHPAEEK